MLVINMFSGPGAGKSSVAAGLFHELKRLHVSCELVTEFGKDKVYEHLDKAFSDQTYLMGNQHFALHRLRNEGVDVAITDAPILMSCIYNHDASKLQNLDALALELHERFDNLNIFVQRGESFETKGRIHTLEQSLAIDTKIQTFLDSHQIPFYTFHVNDAIAKILDLFVKPN